MSRNTERWEFERQHGNPLTGTEPAKKPSKLSRIIERARRMNRIKDGLVLCDNCDTPASKSLSLSLSWTGCAPCVWGEADSFDAADLIHVPGGAK